MSDASQFIKEGCARIPVRYIELLLLVVLVPMYMVGYYPGFLGRTIFVLVFFMLAIYVFSFYCIEQSFCQIFFTRLKNVSIISILLLIFVFGICYAVAFRAEKPETIMHDGALQSEYAYDFLLQGKNPYTEDYYSTGLAKDWLYIPTTLYDPTIQIYAYLHADKQDLPEIYFKNPALEHYIYLPGMFLLTGPIGQFEKAFFGFQDFRIAMFLALCVTVFFLWKMMRHSPFAGVMILLFLLYPFTYRFLFEGKNDIFVFMCIVVSMYALQRNRNILSGVLFGVAVAIKQFAWYLAPFFLLYLLKPDADSFGTRLKKRLPMLLTSLATFLVFAVPFLAWDAHAFIEDIFLFPFGKTDLTYPISGFGFSPLLVYSGTLSQLDSFPFGYIMGPIAVLLLLILGRVVWKKKSLSSAVGASAVFMIGTLFFSRYMNDNHVEFVVWMLMLWVIILLSERNSNFETDHKMKLRGFTPQNKNYRDCDPIK